MFVSGNGQRRNQMNVKAFKCEIRKRANKGGQAVYNREQIIKVRGKAATQKESAPQKEWKVKYSLIWRGEITMIKSTNGEKEASEHGWKKERKKQPTNEEVRKTTD